MISTQHDLFAYLASHLSVRYVVLDPHTPTSAFVAIGDELLAIDTPIDVHATVAHAVSLLNEAAQRELAGRGSYTERLASPNLGIVRLIFGTTDTMTSLVVRLLPPNPDDHAEHPLPPDLLGELALPHGLTIIAGPSSGGATSYGARAMNAALAQRKGGLALTIGSSITYLPESGRCKSLLCSVGPRRDMPTIADALAYASAIDASVAHIVYPDLLATTMTGIANLLTAGTLVILNLRATSIVSLLARLKTLCDANPYAWSTIAYDLTSVSLIDSVASKYVGERHQVQERLRCSAGLRTALVSGTWDRIDEHIAGGKEGSQSRAMALATLRAADLIEPDTR